MGHGGVTTGTATGNGTRTRTTGLAAFNHLPPHFVPPTPPPPASVLRERDRATGQPYRASKTSDLPARRRLARGGGTWLGTLVPLACPRPAPTARPAGRSTI